jgi:hypothetical protein
MSAENLANYRDSIHGGPSRNESLYGLRYLGPLSQNREMIKIKHYMWYMFVKYHLKHIAKNIHMLKIHKKVLRGITCKEGEELTG